MKYQKRNCARCPKFSNGWCAVYAKRVAGAATGCKYGLRMMWNVYMRDRMRARKFGFEKN